MGGWLRVRLRSASNAAAIFSAFPHELFRQALLVRHGLADSADLLHAMAYDQGGDHSTLAFGKKCLDQALALGLPPAKVLCH